MDLGFQFPSPANLLLLLCLFIIFIFSKLLLMKKKSTPGNLPPGPWKLPLIGNMHNLIGPLPPHRKLQELSATFGAVMHLQIGELSAVVVSTPSAAKQVMKTHDINSASRPHTVATEIFTYGGASISFSDYGDYWRQLRKISTLELLSNKRVSSFRSIREEACLELARGVASHVGGPAVNLTEKLFSFEYGLVSRATLGKKTEVKERLLPILREGTGLAAGFDIADVYPSVKVLQMVSGMRRRLVKLHVEADSILDEIIRDRKVDGGGTTAVKKEGEEEDDLLGVLLRMDDDGRLEIPLTTDNVKAVLVDILTAGSETSAITIDWAMSEMLRNPRILKKAQDEVRRVFDDKGYVDESKINELEYLKSIIKETLRFHPPLPLLLPRKCREKCEIDGYEIPVDTKIIVNAWAINRDPKYWKNADCFEPERFLDKLVDYKGNHFEYIPFGAGRRICPGMSLGVANVELPLAMFLYHFDWELGDGMKLNEELDMEEGFGLSVGRKNGLLVVPVISRPLPLVVT
ncbi:hypothetical protein ABFS82_13G159600 [Erythranthe guttata]